MHPSVIAALALARVADTACSAELERRRRQVRGTAALAARPRRLSLRRLVSKTSTIP